MCHVCAAIQSTDKCLTGIWHPTTGKKGAKEETVKNTNVIDYFSKLIGTKSTKLPKAAVNAVKERGIYKVEEGGDEEESQSTSESEQQGDDANSSD